MTSLEYIDGDALRSVLSMAAAIDALEETFGHEPLPLTPQRSVIQKDDGQLLLMPSWDEQAAGVKLVTLKEANPQRGLPLINGVYVLFSSETLQPVALFDAAPLTALRTAAVSALATKHLARDDARRLVVFGAGVQASAHVEAMRVVREIDSVTIVSHTSPQAESLIEAIGRSGLNAGSGSPDDVVNADIVCTCTTTTNPLFAGAHLPPGCHINGIGSHRPDVRELDTDTVRKATVVVETREAAMAEAGDLIIPVNEGAISPAHLAGDLADVVAGRLRRRASDEITLFKSVGVAFEDLAVASAYHRLVAG